MGTSIKLSSTILQRASTPASYRRLSHLNEGANFQCSTPSSAIQTPQLKRRGSAGSPGEHSCCCCCWATALPSEHKPLRNSPRAVAPAAAPAAPLDCTLPYPAPTAFGGKTASASRSRVLRLLQPAAASSPSLESATAATRPPSSGATRLTFSNAAAVANRHIGGSHSHSHSRLPLFRAAGSKGPEVRPEAAPAATSVATAPASMDTVSGSIPPAGSARAGCASSSNRSGGESVAVEAAWAEDVPGTGSPWPTPRERLTAVRERLLARKPTQYAPVSGRFAAVLVGLFEDRRGVVRVLLTQRSARLTSHRGEVCLPGGKRDEADADDVATALREAHEELGIDPARVSVVGCLPPVLSKHHLSVTPVLAILPPDLVPVPNPHEVAAAFTVPLAVFLGQTADPRVATSSSVGPGQSQQQGATQDGVAADAAVPRRGKRRQQAVATTGRSAALAGSLPKGTAFVWRPSDGSGTSVEGEAKPSGGSAGASPPAIAEDDVYDEADHHFRDITWGQHEYRIHSFVYGDFDVWGLTATICITAARVALGRTPSFQELSPGGHHYSCFYHDGSALRVRREVDLEVQMEGPPASSAAEASAGEGAVAVGEQAEEDAAGDLRGSSSGPAAGPGTTGVVGGKL